MALAIVQQAEPRGNALVVSLETGSNRYFQVWVGSKERVVEEGISRMESPVKRTPILGPLPDSALGRVQLPIPRRWFDRKNRYLQVATYSSPKGAGPAWSSILPITGFTDDSGDSLLPIHLPTVQSMSLPSTQNAPFRYKEMPLSRQMNFMEILKGILPGLLGAAGDAMQKSADKNPKMKEVTTKAADLVKSDQVAGLLEALLAALIPPKKEVKEKAASLSWQGHSQQMMIPIPIIDALLKAVPALAPVLQSAVQGLTDPKFIDAIGRNSPVNKILDSSTDIIKDVLGANVDVNTNVEDMTQFGSDINTMLAAMLKQNEIKPESKAQSLSLFPKTMKSITLSTATNDQLKASGIDFLPVPQVMLSLGLQTNGTHLADLASVYFASGRDIRMPLNVATPKPIAKAWLFAGIRSANGKKWILRKKYKVEQVSNGPLAIIPTFTAQELAGLAPNMEYTLSFRMVWPNKRGQRVGTAVSRVVKFVAPLAYDRVVEGGGQPIPLNDIAKFRDYWHKVWGVQMTQDFRDIALDCKYYVTMSTGTGPNHRLETLTQFEADRTGKHQGKLKSGMEWGLESLSALIPLVSDKPALSSAEKAALSDAGFAHRFTQVARMKVEYWGLEGESVALWTYPEVKMHDVILKTPLVVDDNGMVAEMGEKIVQVPIPSQVHFIGAKI